jgi:hypothetical protein
MIQILLESERSDAAYFISKFLRRGGMLATTDIEFARAQFERARAAYLATHSGQDILAYERTFGICKILRENHS